MSESQAWITAAGVVGALLTGFFASGKVAEALKNLLERVKQGEARLEKIEAQVGPIQTTLALTKLAELPERLIRFEQQLRDSVAGVQGVKDRIEQMVTRQEFQVAMRERDRRLRDLTREVRVLRVRSHRDANDLHTLLLMAGKADRIGQRESELSEAHIESDHHDEEGSAWHEPSPNLPSRSSES